MSVSHQTLKRLVHGASCRLGCSEWEIFYRFGLTFESPERSEYLANVWFRQFNFGEYSDNGGLEGFCVDVLCNGIVKVKD